MGAIRVILLVAFVIVCVLLVLIVLVQDDGKSGMGGLLGGRGTTAFGSHSANVLTRATFTLVVIFFVLVFTLALLNKKPRLQQNLLPIDANQSTIEKQGNTWWENETPVTPATEGTTETSGEEIAAPQN